VSHMPFRTLKNARVHVRNFLQVYSGTPRLFDLGKSVNDKAPTRFYK
jgi:hypothetical protein